MNTAALVLDIFPGLILMEIPFVIDAVSGSFDRMPEAYAYICDGQTMTAGL